MYRWLFLSWFAILVLFFLLFFDYAESINEINLNEKIEISGVVENVRISGQLQYFEINGFEFFCECFINVEGKEVNLIGRLENFYEDKKIRVLSLEIL